MPTCFVQRALMHMLKAVQTNNNQPNLREIKMTKFNAQDREAIATLNAGLLDVLEDRDLYNEFQEGLLAFLTERDSQKRQALKSILAQMRELKFTQDEINSLFEPDVVLM